jgi:hypothetical protein
LAGGYATWKIKRETSSYWRCKNQTRVEKISRFGLWDVNLKKRRVQQLLIDDLREGLEKRRN